MHTVISKDPCMSDYSRTQILTHITDCSHPSILASAWAIHMVTGSIVCTQTIAVTVITKPTGWTFYKYIKRRGPCCKAHTLMQNYSLCEQSTAVYPAVQVHLPVMWLHVAPFLQTHDWEQPKPNVGYGQGTEQSIAVQPKAHEQVPSIWLHVAPFLQLHCWEQNTPYVSDGHGCVQSTPVQPGEQRQLPFVEKQVPPFWQLHVPPHWRPNVLPGQANKWDKNREQVMTNPSHSNIHDAYSLGICYQCSLVCMCRSHLFCHTQRHSNTYKTADNYHRNHLDMLQKYPIHDQLLIHVELFSM